MDIEAGKRREELLENPHFVAYDIPFPMSEAGNDRCADADAVGSENNTETTRTIGENLLDQEKENVDSSNDIDVSGQTNQDRKNNKDTEITKETQVENRDEHTRDQEKYDSKTTCRLQDKGHNIEGLADGKHNEELTESNYNEFTSDVERGSVVVTGNENTNAANAQNIDEKFGLLQESDTVGKDAEYATGEKTNGENILDGHRTSNISELPDKSLSGKTIDNHETFESQAASIAFGADIKNEASKRKFTDGVTDRKSQFKGPDINVENGEDIVTNIIVNSEQEDPEAQQVDTSGPDLDIDSGRVSPSNLRSTRSSTDIAENQLCLVVGTSVVMKQRIHQIVTSMMLLEEGQDPEHLLTSLKEIIRTVNKKNKAVVSYLEENSVHWPVLTVMNHVPDSRQVQTTGISLVYMLVDISEKFIHFLMDSNLHCVLLKVMSDFPGEPVIQECGVKLFAVMAVHDKFWDQIFQNNLKEAMAKVVCSAISAFPDFLSIQAAASSAILKLLSSDDTTKDYWMTSVGDIMIKSLRAESNIPSKINTLQVLNLVAKKKSHRVTLQEKNVHTILIDLCRKWPADDKLMSETLKLLLLLMDQDSVTNAVALTNFVPATLCTVMDKLLKYKDVQGAGLRIMESCLPDVLVRVSSTSDTTKTLIRTVYRVLFAQQDHSDIQVSGCRIISLTLEHCPGAHMWIGEDEKQYPLHNTCMTCLLHYRKKADVFVAVCDAVYWIAADNERLSKLLESKNSHVAIIEGMKRHRKKPSVASAGCKALRGLCIFLHEHKTTVVFDGALAVLTDLQDRYSDSAPVQTEVVSTLTCLMDVDIVPYQCLIEKVPQKIIQAMNRFPEEPVLQEAGLESFAASSVAEGSLHTLVGSGAINTTIQVMNMYRNNELMQKKGLMVFQLFAGQIVLRNKETLHKVADIILFAMENFAGVKGIQTEACVAIQLLAENSTEMSVIFVEKGCHERLFPLLEDIRNTGATGLQEIAGECLYVLSQEQNLKSVMLLSACKSGTLPATGCLIELGADVNTGHGEHTPLSVAVLNKYENIVSLILKQSQDVKDIMTPLRQSLSQDTHIITGLILEAIGYKEGDKDAVINWSCLNLTTFEASWIITALTDRRLKDNEIDTGKNYTEKIRIGENKRKGRRRTLEYSHSDSSTRVRRVRIRHQSQENAEVKEMFEEPLTKSSTPAPATIGQRQDSVTRKILKRSQSFDERKPIPSVSRESPTLPTIVALKPTGLEFTGEADLPVFNISPTEEHEWKQTTLTGANITYSINDPRQSPVPLRKGSAEGRLSPWMRKSAQVQRLSWSSSDENLVPRIDRKMSAPVLGLSGLHMQRHFSYGDLTDAKSEKSSFGGVHLETLDVSENLITNFDAIVNTTLAFHLRCLKFLDIHGNKITELPPDIHQNLPNLEVLDATSNMLEVFPEAIVQCKHLRELRLSNNKITKIKLKHFSMSLKSLYLSHNLLTALPTGLGNYLHNLEELLLDSNDLNKLPKTSIGLKKLKTLDISRNCIEEVSDGFLQLCHDLETLDISYNQLRRLPDEGLAPQLPNLSKLKLRSNILTDKAPFYIPKFILQLPGLRTVDISDNDLCGLPPLSDWSSHVLKDFYASKNRIEKLNLNPPKVWSKLEKLHLAHNNLKEIPKEIGGMTCLRSLDFSHNKGITTLPDELGRCSNIYEMPIDGLDLDLDRGLQKRRVKDIISYLHNRLKKAQRYYRMKLMVVGFGGRGKTTLLNTLMKTNISKKDKNGPTVGVVVRDWSYIRYEKRSNEDRPTSLLFSSRKIECTLNTWDFAGQEEFYSTHNCYLSNRAVYLVVFDLSKKVGDVENLKSWLASIRSRAPGCPVIVVGTHLDRLSRDHEKFVQEKKNIEEKIRELNIKPGFPTINAVHFVDASCENERIRILRHAIQQVVHSFEVRGKRVMGEKIPASYVKLSELLTKKARSCEIPYPVIKHKDLMDMVAEENLDLDEDELQQAVRFLHESGVILHYEDSSLQLRDLYFIDPGWLCRMMAQVITVRQINPFVKDGIMQKSDIALLFRTKDSNYPSDLIPQYIKLLEKFEIALPQSDKELLIPSKLPRDKPNIHIPLDSPHGRITRIYRMPYVPVGLWYRLISRILSLVTQKGFNLLMDLDRSPNKQCWRQGLYVYWSTMAYVMLDSEHDDKNQSESIRILVPKSRHGSRLLGQIVDILDGLIDEWYPGLTCIDPLMGHEILEILAPCSHCQDKNVHMFTISELSSMAAKQNCIHCPNHNGDILLSELTPDLVLGDIEEEFHLDENKLHFEEKPENRLGDGSFGDVYKARYGNKDVAVKCFKEIAYVNTLTMLRKEATILRCLNHVSVVSMEAVGVRPCVILMEFAPHGNLGTLIKGNRMVPKALQLRIALQIAEGLLYLHSKMIVYRDMKPDNVLIFNTSLEETINAKISDYGISRFTSLQGLKAQEGTLAYRAPEVIKKENYLFPADIFSFGLTLYVMLTKRHPFDYLESKGEMDRAIAEGTRFPPFKSVAWGAWPDMQHVITRCLQYSPSERPDAKTIVSMLRRPEVYALQKSIPVSKSCTVECFAMEEVFTTEKKRDTRLWIASGDSASFQISYIYLSDPKSKIKGYYFNHGRIMCMQLLAKDYLAVGTQTGTVWIFNTSNFTLLHSSADLQDSVLCMEMLEKQKEDSLLMVGLANGKVAIFVVSDFLVEPNYDPICLYPGENEPVLCMARLRKRLFLSCGSSIVVLNAEKYNGVKIEKLVETEESSDKSPYPIYAMAVLRGSIIFSKKNTTQVEIWDATKEKVERSFSADTILGTSRPEARVTALMVDNMAIWLGTHSGHIGIVDFKTLCPLVVTHRHMTSVRGLVRSLMRVPDSNGNYVLSGGLGFREIDGEKDKHALCGYVIVWDADFQKYAKDHAEYERQRSACQRRIERMDRSIESTENDNDEE